MVRSGARLSGGVSCDCHAVSHARSLSRRTASSSRSQVRASPPCCVGRLTLAQPSASVHRHTLAAGGIVTQLVTRPSSGYDRAGPGIPRPPACKHCGQGRLTCSSPGERLRGVSVSDRDSPLITVRSGTPRARLGRGSRMRRNVAESSGGRTAKRDRSSRMRHRRASGGRLCAGLD